MVYIFRHGGREKCLDGEDLPKTEGVCTRERLRVSGWSIKGTTYYPAKDMIFLVFWTLARYLGQSY